MRILFLLFLISFSFAANDEITYFMDLSLKTSCPGDILHINATTTSGEPATDVELRLVRYLPYQGLRALKHTDENGLVTMELTKTGLYRIYIQSEKYDHDKYVPFNYSKMCPPPPPKTFNISLDPDCQSKTLNIDVTDGGVPLENVFVRTEKWSSLTPLSGKLSFPIDEGWVYVFASKSGYRTEERHINVNCTPPQCTMHDDCALNQYCTNEKCLNISGDCGYVANHTWFYYECCSDSDCDEDFECRYNTCVQK